jgi:hypothetical protein
METLSPRVPTRLAGVPKPTHAQGDPLARLVARALMEELVSDGRFIEMLADAVAGRVGAAPQQVPPAVIPGPVPAEVPPAQQAPFPGRRGRANRDTPAYKARKAWSQKNFYRRRKGLPLLPRPASWDAPLPGGDKGDEEPAPQEGG